jgi:hypothetical protein
MPHFGVRQQIRALLGCSPICRAQALPHLARIMLGERRAVRRVFALEAMIITLEPGSRLDK